MNGTNFSPNLNCNLLFSLAAQSYRLYIRYRHVHAFKKKLTHGKDDHTDRQGNRRKIYMFSKAEALGRKTGMCSNNFLSIHQLSFDRLNV